MTEPSPTPDPSASQQPAPPLVDPAVALSALSPLALAAQQGFGREAAPERQRDPSVTLRVYADLFDTDLDAVAVTLHSRYSHSRVGNVWAREPTSDRSQTSKPLVPTIIKAQPECGRRDSNPQALSSTGT